MLLQRLHKVAHSVQALFARVSMETWLEQNALPQQYWDSAYLSFKNAAIGEYLTTHGVRDRDNPFASEPSVDVLSSEVPALLKWVVTVAQRCVIIGIITSFTEQYTDYLLTCPNNDTLLCYSNDPFLTVCELWQRHGPAHKQRVMYYKPTSNRAVIRKLVHGCLIRIYGICTSDTAARNVYAIQHTHITECNWEVIVTIARCTCTVVVNNSNLLFSVLML